MNTYRVVDIMDKNCASEYIQASSSNVAMNRFFKKHLIKEKPVRSKKQTHKRAYDCRFYAVRVDKDGNKLQGSFTGFNREGYEFDTCAHKEIDEKKMGNVDWQFAERYHI